MNGIGRREMLQRSAVLSLSGTMPHFLRSVSAAEPSSDRILVVVQMSGGNDGINTVVPFADDAYLANRQALRLNADRLLTIDQQTGFHASMRGMADLLEQQRLAVIQGVGYPSPSRSHEVSMAVWQTASTDQEDHDGYGWLGRAFDGASDAPVPPSLLVSDQEVPMALRGRRAAPLTIDSIDEFEDALTTDEQRANSLNQPSVAEFMRQASHDASTMAERIQGVSEKGESGQLGRLRSALARRLKAIANLIRSEFGPRVYYCMQSGYDTHVDQLRSHANLLGNLSLAVKAFLDDMEAAGLSDRVVVLCFSEFGRQVKENASLGTDHGTAGPVFLAGKGVRSGLHGEAPDLTKLTRNAPDHTVDFRGVYASVLEDWLGAPRAKIIDPQFERLPLFV